MVESLLLHLGDNQHFFSWSTEISRFSSAYTVNIYSIFVTLCLAGSDSKLFWQPQVLMDEGRAYLVPLTPEPMISISVSSIGFSWLWVWHKLWQRTLTHKKNKCRPCDSFSHGPLKETAFHDNLRYLFLILENEWGGSCRDCKCIYWITNTLLVRSQEKDHFFLVVIEIKAVQWAQMIHGQMVNCRNMC